MHFADPKSDIAFKKVFGSDQHAAILISFLNAALDLQGDKAIAELTILNPYQAPKISLLKETNLDVRATTNGGVTFIVEMQVEKQDYFAKRALYYTAKAYVSQIAKAEQYPKLNQVIFVGIMDFTLFETPEYVSRHLILNEKTHTQDIRDFELNFIELPKFTLTESDLRTVIEKWVYFFKHAGNLTMIPATLTNPPELADAFDILEQHTWTREEVDIYDYWAMKDAGHQDALDTAKRDGYQAGRQEGRQEGLQEGLQEGRRESQHQIALEMLRDNAPIEMVMKWTGLSKKEVERLKNQPAA